MENEVFKSIKNWDENDQPREKLLKLGKEHLTDAELLAILIATGSKNLSAVALCTQILDYANNDLSILGKMTVKDFCKFKGIGPAKAITIVAALEIGRRRQSENVAELKKITSSQDVYRVFLSLLSDKAHEEFWVLFLNRANHIIGKEKISSGGITGTVADVKLIVKSALERLASGIVLVHNHPSGHLAPSQADIQLTEKTKAAAKLLDIQVLDHLIVSNRGFYSFADSGIL
jgi:DNA repair protein RadC